MDKETFEKIKMSDEEYLKTLSDKQINRYNELVQMTADEQKEAIDKVLEKKYINHYFI